jgi:hypothetical protein
MVTREKVKKLLAPRGRLTLSSSPSLCHLAAPEIEGLGWSCDQEEAEVTLPQPAADI